MDLDHHMLKPNEAPSGGEMLSALWIHTGALRSAILERVIRCSYGRISG
jgi:hypothetical protein